MVGPLTVLIPGAREAGARRQVSTPLFPVLVPNAPTTTAPEPDPGQLEYARQGGGAPSERRVETRPSRLARFGAWLFR